MAQPCCPDLPGDFHYSECLTIAAQVEKAVEELELDDLPCDECDLVTAHSIRCSKFWKFLHQDEPDYVRDRSNTVVSCNHCGQWPCTNPDEYALQFDPKPPMIYTLKKRDLGFVVGSAIGAGVALGAFVGYMYSKWQS